VNCLLAATESDAKGSPGVVPTRDAFFHTHHSAGAALKATGVLKVNRAILQPVTPGGADDQTNLGRALCANRLIDKDVRMTFVHTELVEGK
jgi:hypothetical protein